MRFALSIAIILSATAAPAVAQETLFVYEPQGQAFSPPPVRVVPDDPASRRALADATAECNAYVKNIFAYRELIWTGCMNKRLQPSRRIVVHSGSNRLAAKQDVQAPEAYELQ